jgi:alpha/beta superfamily hydrolase
MSPINIDGCFGWLHTPKVESHSSAVVLCPGLRYDDLTGYSSMRLLADALANQGYPTLRLHYSGTGNSCDPGAVNHWTAWQQNIHSAADWLRGNFGVQRIVLCGLRLGAILAATVAANRKDVAALILLAPVLRGRSYTRQLMMESAPSSDGHIDLGRLRLPPETIASINQFELCQARWGEDCKVAAIFQNASSARLECEATWKKAGVDVTSRDFDGLEPMLRPTFAIHEQSAAVDPIVTWLSNALPGGPNTTQRDWSLEEVELNPGGCAETPIFFGPSHELFGILCRPYKVQNRVVVLMGNSSGDPHCADAAVGIARNLAAEGVASLRFDFAGIGDSPAIHGNSHVFETDRSADFSAAMDALEALGYREFAAQGLCSGAYHAYHAAVADRRIKSVLLINLPFFKWTLGFPVDELSFDLRPPSHFVQSMRMKAFWVSLLHKLLHGELKIRKRFASIETKLGRFPGFVQELEAATKLSKRVQMLFLVSKGDVSTEVLKRTFGQRSMPSGTQMELVPGLDHAMTGSAMRKMVASRMVRLLAEQHLAEDLHDARNRTMISRLPTRSVRPNTIKPVGVISDME